MIQCVNKRSLDYEPQLGTAGYDAAVYQCVASPPPPRALRRHLSAGLSVKFPEKSNKFGGGERSTLPRCGRPAREGKLRAGGALAAPAMTADRRRSRLEPNGGHDLEAGYFDRCLDIAENAQSRVIARWVQWPGGTNGNQRLGALRLLVCWLGFDQNVVANWMSA